MNDAFRKFSHAVSCAVGSPVAFALSAMVVLVWACLGPIFQFSDTWQLVINTGTTIVTFLMVFLIQNTQNRDGRVIQMKLDELIRASRTARNKLIDLEELSEEELDELHQEFLQMHEEALHRLGGIEKAKAGRTGSRKK